MDFSLTLILTQVLQIPRAGEQSIQGERRCFGPGSWTESKVNASNLFKHGTRILQLEKFVLKNKNFEIQHGLIFEVAKLAFQKYICISFNKVFCNFHVFEVT